MTPRRAFSSALLAVLPLLTVPGSARAQSSNESAAAGQLLFQEGRQLLEAGNAKEACS